MKQIFIISSILFTFTISSYGQSLLNNEGFAMPTGNSREDRSFRDALSKPRTAKEYYKYVNTDTKNVVTLNELLTYCKEHNYRTREYATKYIQKFGDVATTINWLEFIPEELYINYVFDWTDKASIPSSKLKNVGSVYFFFGAPSFRFIRLDNAKWSGDISNGYVNGEGAGIYRDGENMFCYFCGTFKNGYPVGKAKFRVIDTNVNGWGYSPREISNTGRQGTGAPFREVELGEMSDGMALFRYTDTGEGKSAFRMDNRYGYVNKDGIIVIKQIYNVASSFNNGKAAVLNEKGEEIYIDKKGEFVDYTPKQKKIFADKKAEEDRIAAEKERQELIAKQKAEQERREAEAREADLKRRIEINKDVKLWSIGCRLCYRFPNTYNFVIATLEEWSPDRSRVKVKVVASPSSSSNLNGESLTKNNTMWVATTGEGWHLALKDEIEIAVNNDGSIPKDYTCSDCNGRGTQVCYRCEGKGRIINYRDNWETCSKCLGKGSYMCPSCRGSGKNY